MDGSSFRISETKPLFRLAEADGPAYEVYAPGRVSRYLVVCDHARNRIPACLGDLGLSESARQEHFAWDPGSEELGRYLADLLGASAIMAGFSRLVIDPNRVLTNPALCSPHEDETDIPGNIGISEAEKQARIDQLFVPYHTAIADALAAIRARGEEPVLISPHSFVPQYRKGEYRPWHIGVLWREDQRMSRPFINALRARGDLEVGDNQPYCRRSYRFHTIEHHAEDVGIANLLFEVRHDLIRTDAEQKRWAGIIYEALPKAICQSLSD